MSDNNQPTILVFEKCPSCGSKRALVRGMAKEVKDRGITRPEWDGCVAVLQGVVQDPDRAASLPVGIELPAFNAYMDLCTECGAYYATKIEIGRAKVSLKPARIALPGDMGMARN